MSYAARRRGGREGREGQERKASYPLFVPAIINVAGRFDHADPAAITSRFGADVFERMKELERVVMVEGADHNFTERAKADELIDAVVDFVSETLSDREREAREIVK